MTEIIGTDYRAPANRVHVLPVPDIVLKVRLRERSVVVNAYNVTEGTPTTLIQTPGATWPPKPRLPVRGNGSSFCLADVVTALGMSPDTTRNLLADRGVQHRARSVGFEHAAIETLSRRAGVTRVEAVVAALREDVFG